MNLESAQRALLDLVEADRARQCAAILGDAEARAQALRRQTQAEALARLRQTFDEQRQLQQQHLAAALARLATRRRLQAQQRSSALLREAWQRLPAALQARWQQPAARAAWVAGVLRAAQACLPQGAWRIVHAADWPAAERQALADALAGPLGERPRFEPDDSIGAGLKIAVEGNVIDGTLAGLLADRAAIDARLLQHLENAA
jgi:hypothetical protein